MFWYLVCVSLSPVFRYKPENQSSSYLVVQIKCKCKSNAFIYGFNVNEALQEDLLNSDMQILQTRRSVLSVKG